VSRVQRYGCDVTLDRVQEDCKEYYYGTDVHLTCKSVSAFCLRRVRNTSTRRDIGIHSNGEKRKELITFRFGSLVYLKDRAAEAEVEEILK
jgi:hypothetical protein